MNENKLKKQLRLYDVFSICTGAMFSSGFFLLPGIAAAQTGSSVYLAYLASGILIVPAMLSVAELSTAMPKSGGTYYFLDRSLGPLFGTIGGLGSWIALMFKSAFALIGMGAYLSLYLDTSFTALALILTIIFGLLNIFGAKETTLLQRILVTVLVTIMAVFIIQGLGFTGLNGSGLLAHEKASFFKNDLHGFISTIGLVFVSYAGLTKVTSVAEEVENPDRNIPLGMMLSLATASLIYVAGVYIMQSVLPPAELYESLTPVADAGAKFMSWLPGSLGVFMIMIAAVAAFASTGNAGIMSASRYPFAMSKDKLVSKKFGELSNRGTPAFSIVVTVGCMVFILLVFNVEAVAKLASAFQLLLFGLMCFSVVVMRESNIKGYQPGFRSPLYPWIQIAGMLISVWLIAEMGLLAVSLTGFIIIMCAGWYIYYTKGELNRRGAIFHVHERLGQQRNDALEYEMLGILNEKSGNDHLSYKNTIARSVIVDITEQETSMHDMLSEGSGILSGRIKIEKKKIHADLLRGNKSMFNKLGKGAVYTSLSYDGVEEPELLIFRIKSGANFELDSENVDVSLFAILISPMQQVGLDVRLMGHLAEIVRTENFNNRWQLAINKKELREALLSEEHFMHLKVKGHKKAETFIGKKVSEVPLPGSCLITILYRGQEIIIPHGNTVIGEQDELLMVGTPEDIKLLQKADYK